MIVAARLLILTRGMKAPTTFYKNSFHWIFYSAIFSNSLSITPFTSSPHVVKTTTNLNPTTSLITPSTSPYLASRPTDLDPTPSLNITPSSPHLVRHNPRLQQHQPKSANINNTPTLLTINNPHYAAASSRQQLATLRPKHPQKINPCARRRTVHCRGAPTWSLFRCKTP